MTTARCRVLAVATLGLACAPATTAHTHHDPTAPASAPVPAQAPMTPPPAAVTARDPAQDPTVTDPDHYRAILENERTRVLRYHDAPGARTHQHQHPASVLYALSAFKRRLIFPDGTSRERTFSVGDVMWLPAQTHAGQNIGTTDTEVLLIEFKD